MLLFGFSLVAQMVKNLATMQETVFIGTYFERLSPEKFKIHHCI